LKYAEVRPLFKSGSNKELSNFRLISVLTSFSKTFERIIYDRLYQHLNYNTIGCRGEYLGIRERR
jgi:hypothetical protein